MKRSVAVVAIVLVGLVFAAVTIPLMPLGVVTTWLRRRQSLRTT
jgi:hypothetical protein